MQLHKKGHDIKLAIAACLTGLVLVGCATKSPLQEGLSKAEIKKASETYVQIGYEHLKRGKLPEARYALTRAMEMRPDAWEAHLGFAKLYEVEGEPNYAEKYYEQAKDLGGGKEVQFHYAAFLYNNGEQEEGCDQLQDLSQDTRFDKRSQVFLSLASCSRNQGDEAAMVDHIRKALQVDRNNGSAHYALAKYHFDRKEFDQSWKSYSNYNALVQSRYASYSAESLWLGMRLAALRQNFDMRNHLAAILENQYPNSPEFKQYRDGTR